MPHDDRSPMPPPGSMVGDIEVLFMPSAPLTESADEPGFAPGRTLLKKGSFARPHADDPERSDWGLRLPLDIVLDRDVAIVLRDGTRMHVDVYRPADAPGALPTLMGWSPYGKARTMLPAERCRHFRIDTDKLSGLQRFEGPDPAWWCARGYAVVSPDPRGSYRSEGDLLQWGPVCAADGSDVIAWIAQQPWSNGKVGLTGNSWLGISQWFIAAARPPALAAIAPWEALVDSYRDNTARGGIPDADFAHFTLSTQVGRGRTESAKAMIERHPCMNAYWESKIAPLERIEVPAYVVASWTNSLHTPGTFTGWERIGSSRKWLRVHNTHEWCDYYDRHDDLLKFFDHFLKGANNGWNETPAVRLAVFDEGHADVLDRAEAEFPLARTVYRALHLDAASGRLLDRPTPASSSAAYIGADDQGQVIFTHTFAADTELTGFMTLRVWMQAEAHDDMDVFVQVQKLDEQGRPMRFNHPAAADLFPTTVGPQGRHRASHRELDAQRSKAHAPYHSFRHPQKLVPGEVVALEIALSPAGTRYRQGQSLRLSIAGFRQGPKGFPHIADQGPRLNRGRHIVHTGGAWDSVLLIPVVSG